MLTSGNFPSCQKKCRILEIFGCDALYEELKFWLYSFSKKGRYIWNPFYWRILSSIGNPCLKSLLKLIFFSTGANGVSKHCPSNTKLQILSSLAGPSFWDHTWRCKYIAVRFWYESLKPKVWLVVGYSSFYLPIKAPLRNSPTLIYIYFLG